MEKGRPAPDMIYLALKRAGGIEGGYAAKVGDTRVDVEASDNAYMPGILVLTGSIKTQEDAEKVNQELDRKHLILSSLVDVINYTLDGTLEDRIRELNK